MEKISEHQILGNAPPNLFKLSQIPKFQYFVLKFGEEFWSKGGMFEVLLFDKHRAAMTRGTGPATGDRIVSLITPSPLDLTQIWSFQFTDS